MAETKKYYATFFISTGRCATQWFADKLASNYQDFAEVVHEPFNEEYTPKKCFESFNRGVPMAVLPQIKKHFKRIERTLKSKHYIEVGWPVYGVLPYIISELNISIKIIHLYRHPIRVAASLMTHNVYNRGQWSELVAISPSDYGVVQSDLAGDLWKGMSDFEKCLFWWFEINHWALFLQKTFNSTQWLSLKYEDVFGENRQYILGNVLEFLELPEREGFFLSQKDKVDRFQLKVDDNFEIGSINKYPKVLGLMSSLGYDLGDVSAKEINKRFKNSLLKRVAHKIKIFS